MKKEDCFVIGWFTKTHGTQGGIYLKLDTDRPESYEKIKTILIEKGGSLVPYFIEDININGGNAIVKFEGLKTADEAKLLVGKEVFLPENLLPKGDEAEYFFHELLGMKVTDKKEGDLGRVNEVLESSGGLMYLQILEGKKEILIPVNDYFINKVDKKNQVIFTDLPEGLVDVNNGEEVEPDDLSDDLSLTEDLPE